MEISNNDLARILGRMEEKLDAQAVGLSALDAKVSMRLDDHHRGLRELEAANPKAIGEKVEAAEKRIAALEADSVRTGMIAGAGSGLAMALIGEWLRHKLGL